MPSTSLRPPLRIVRQGQIITLHGVPADRTLLQVLREDLHCTAVKEGCASGDCGACTVTLAERTENGRLRWHAINSCIRLAHSVDGMALWTAQDIAAPDGSLHPVQQALVQHHGSQCGFCTPGFVMSLFTLYQQRSTSGPALTATTPITRDEALHALSGNLCRCTGYRPILDAAQALHQWPVPPGNETDLLQKLELLARYGQAQMPDLANEPADSFYARPPTLAQLLALHAAYPQAQIVAGATDVGLWITKQHRRFAQVIDVTRVAELRHITRTDTPTGSALRIGAAVSLNDAFAALAQDRPALQAFFHRFAGQPVRTSGTLGGNVANGSPIGDSMPLLIALGATLVLASPRGQRQLPIEDFYLAYRQTALAPDEVLAAIDVPLPTASEHVCAYKVSKRQEDDISAVCLAVALRVEGGVIAHARIGAGGVAAIPARAIKTEASLVHQTCANAVFESAAQVLQGEFEPMSDMRASAAYRRQVLGQLLLRCGDELQASPEPSLSRLQPV
ncbi:MAG: xanthine dehydrogenase small subunit [Pseudomonadota bacterium]|nr:xanthine dehydrogenase small subunit [Pseudomonadota bacterium]